MGTYKRGRHGVLYLDTTNVTGLTDVSVGNPHTMLDTTVNGDYYATQLKDIKGPWTASFSGKRDATTFATIFALSQAETERRFKFYPDSATVAQYFYGTGWFSVDQSGVLGDSVNFSGAFDGTGELKWCT